MLKIDRPGIYRGVSDAAYRRDPCPSPSLTQSMCKVLLEQSPWHAWTGSATLNPNWMPDDDDKKFDLGNVAHALILGRGKDFEVLDFDNWTTKASKEARAEAKEAGSVPILMDQFNQAVRMQGAAIRQLKTHQDRDAFTNGSPEVMICWEENGVWFRSLVDWLHDDLRTVDDYKSTGMSVAEHVLGIRAEAGGWHVQHAFIERGLDILDPAGAGRRRFRNIAQETDDPFALNVMHMTEHWMTMGRKKVHAAVTMWEQCIRADKWPGYPKRGLTPEYPSYKETQWLAREMSGEFEAVDSLMGG